MHPELERLIEMAIADGKITEKERSVILQKAEKLGVDKDEIELILEGELAIARKQQTQGNQDKPKSNKVGDTKKCPSCGAPVPALQLTCKECGHDFNAETDSNRQIRDYIRELQNLLLSIDNEKIRFLGKETSLASYNPAALNIKKAQVINTFTLPNTKESLVQLLIFAYSNYESTHDNALAPNPMKKAWLGKAIQAYSLLKAQKEGDSKIQNIVQEYSFLDSANQDQIRKKGQIEKTLSDRQGSSTKKVLKYGGIGCGSVILISMLISLFGLFKMYNSKDFMESFKPSKPETTIDSLLTLGQVDKAKGEAVKLEEYSKNEALDKIKEYEYKRLLESNDIDNARNKANSISSDYKRKEAIDDIIVYEVNRLIEAGNIEAAMNKTNVINSDYKRKEIKDKILLIEIDKLIEKRDLEGARDKARQIDNSYTRQDAMEKIKSSRN